jgi:hypothetical protein
MRSRFFCVLLGLAMGWTAVGAAASFPHEEDHKEPDRTAPPYTTQRVVALQEGLSPCPRVDGWKGEKLLDLVQSRADDGERNYSEFDEPLPVDKPIKRSAKLGDLLHKYDLDRFCIYTAPKPAPRFPAQLQSLGLKRADPDRMALTPTAPADLGAVGNQTWPILADHFLDQVGQVRLAPTTAPGVRLAFVDTHSTGEGPPDPPESLRIPGRYPSWHGHAMAQLGQEIVCGHDGAPENCAVHVVTQLALRYDKYEQAMSFFPDPASSKGGHLGLVSDLGVAILAQIERWQNFDPGAKLVLNLSVGWDGERGNDLSAKTAADLETSSALVYNALRIAHHLGVLVIASAGNRTGGEESTSPLLPAAWELRRPAWLRMLRIPLCKVVYAVGGVDWQGLPLPNSRLGGKPWRVAYGDHAVARTSLPGLVGTGAGEPTKMYTGTSVSAAVVSSVAAVTWYLRPDLKPAQVMRRLGQAGKVLDQRADFYAWPWLIRPPHLKRLSLCRTVLRMCGPDERRCGPKLETFNCRLSESPPADLGAILPAVLTRVPFTPRALPSGCDSRTHVFMEPAGNSKIPNPQKTCPMEKLPDMATPYRVSTQPPENPCPTCSIVPDPPERRAALAPNLRSNDGTGGKTYGIAVAVDPDWLSQGTTTLDSAILVVDCQTGLKTKERFDITSVVLPLFRPVPPPSVRLTSVRLSFDKIDGRKSLAGCTASVDFKLQVTIEGKSEERSVQSPVYVDP